LRGPDVLDKPLGLPEEVKAEIATDIKAIIFQKLKTDPRCEGIRANLLEDVIDGDLVVQAYDRAMRRLKRRSSAAHDDHSKSKARVLSKLPEENRLEEQNLQANSNTVGYISPRLLSGDLDAPTLHSDAYWESVIQVMSKPSGNSDSVSTFDWSINSPVVFDPSLMDPTEHDVDWATNEVNEERIFRPPDARPGPPSTVDPEAGNCTDPS
jgi:hypothetical protein